MVTIPEDIPELSRGAINAIYSSDDAPFARNPIVQVLNVKRIAKSNDASATGSAARDRFRLLISDGQNFGQAMLATQLNESVEDQGMDKFSIIRLNEFSCNQMKNQAGQRKLIIIIALEVLVPTSAENPTLDKIGNPVSMDDSSVSEAGGGGGGTNTPSSSNPNNNMRYDTDEVKPNVKPPAVAGGGGARRGGAAGGSGSGVGRGGGPPVRRSGPGGRGGGMGQGAIFPIEGLSPYQNKWTIKARVTNKSDIKYWTNARGEGKLFSVNLLDESGEIKATGFKEAVDNLYEVLEEGKVYYISKAKIGVAKKQFSTLNNDYEITFEKDTIVEPCDEPSTVPQVKFNFVELGQLESVEAGNLIDILGVITSVSDLQELITKAQKHMVKRDITVADRSGFSVRMTLWGRQAETFPESYASDSNVIAFKGVKVGDFGGRTLSMLTASTMVVDPDIEEAHALRGWYDSQGHNKDFKSFSSSGGGGINQFKPDQFRTLSQMHEENAVGFEPTFFHTRATITFVKADNISYPSCPNPTKKCQKKLVQESDEQWKCENCDATWKEPQYRYIVNLSVADYSDTLWLTGFNDIGEAILNGKSANELENLKMEDEDLFKKTINECVGTQWFFFIKARMETFNDISRARYQILKGIPVSANWSKISHDLAREIDEEFDTDELMA